MNIEVRVPSPGESISEVSVGKWYKNTGEFADTDELVVELESEKATLEVRAESAGVIQQMAAEGQTIKVGDVLFKIDTEASVSQPTKKDAAPGAGETNADPIKQAAAEGQKNDSNYAAGHPSPAATKMMAESNIDSRTLQGSGKDGRITKGDVINAVENADKAKPALAGSSAPVREETCEKMSNLRKTIAKRLVKVKNETAMLTTFNEVDMHSIMSLRKKYKDGFKEKYGVNLGFMSFFTKACCKALKLFPSVNARIDNENIIYPNFIDISIAVSTPKGLVVPVLRNAEKMSFSQIEAGIVALAIKARDGKLTMDEMSGGTFTITNGGVFGSMLSTPILNAPQSAILGMHNIVERPVAIKGEVRIRPMMYLALSYDHRIIDGRESVGFLVALKSMLEEPGRMLLGV